MTRTVEFLYLGLSISALVFSLIGVFITGRIGGEFEGFDVTIESYEVLSIFIINIVSLFMVYGLYCYSTKKRIVKKYLLKFNVKYADKIVFVLLVVQVIYTLNTGVGVVGSKNENAYSYLFALISPVPIFYIYYFIARERASLVFYLNVSLFMSTQIVQGWSGFILFLFFCELYFRYNNGASNLLKLFCKIYIFLPMVFVLGALLYKTILPIKNQIRGVGEAEVTYVEAVFALSNRLSFLSVSLATYQNVIEIKDKYESEDDGYREARSLLRPLVPSQLMGDKGFRSFNNLPIWSYYEGVNKYTGAGMGLPVFLYMLYVVSLVEFLSYLVIFILLFVVARLYISMLEQWPGQLDFLYFLFLMKLFVGGSLEVGFSYGIFNSVYLIIIFIAIRVCLIRKVSVDL